MTYNILSPDGFTIRHEDFKTEKDAVTFFQEWKSRFAHQGYYSAIGRRIPLSELENEVEIIKNN